MATIQKRQTGTGETRYRVLVRLKGHPLVSATFKRKLDAERWARNTESAIEENRYFKAAEAKRHTLAELIDRYFESVLPKKRGGGKNQALQLRWWRKTLGERLLSEITPAVIVDARDLLQSESTNRPRSAATLNRYTAALGHVFTVAVKEWMWVDENPLSKISKFPEPPGRVRVLGKQDRERLLSVCKSSRNPHLFPIVILAISTGMRKGEILRLKWSDIDLDRGHLVIQKTKNRERRGIPLSEPVKRALELHGRVRRIDSDFVFPNRSGSAPEDFRASWKKVLKEADIQDFRFHDLRHCAASYMAVAGASPSELAAALGHKSLSMVARYAHIGESHAAGVITRMNEQIFEEG